MFVAFLERTPTSANNEAAAGAYHRPYDSKTFAAEIHRHAAGTLVPTLAQHRAINSRIPVSASARLNREAR